jgi:hypothetical protein
MASAVNWLVTLLFNQTGPIALDRSGWKFYFLFVATNFISALILLFLYPETSGKSLEAIDLVRSLSSLAGSDTKNADWIAVRQT